MTLADSTVGCHVPKFQNWRQSTTPLSQPKFISPLNKIKHDVFINPESSPKSGLKEKCSSDSKNLKLSTSPQLINSEPSVATTGMVNDYTDSNKPKSSKSVDASPHTSNVNKTAITSQKPSNSSCSVPESSKTCETTSNPNISSTSSNCSSAVNNSSSIKNENMAIDVSKNNPADMISSTVTLYDFPVPPKGFPKVFHDPPNPLPIVGDGFLNPNVGAYFMNIQGTCRLCNSNVSSYLIDYHLLCCSGLDRQPMDHFVKSSMKEFSLKEKQVIDAACLLSKFELNEGTVPNKFFKNIDNYRSFARKVENLTKLLFDNAFKKLKISPKLENFNILKYR